MKIDHMSVSNGRLILRAGGRVFPLRDGIYSDLDGGSFTVLRGAVVEASAQVDPRQASMTLGAQIRDAETEIGKWEKQLQTVGDDAQLANIDLQNMLQKQQQTIQMLSNVSKVLHDTALAIIRKIG